MNQLEKDRLIERFMGWRLVLKSNIGWVFVNDAGYELSIITYRDSIIGFTTDWNWLIKALYKFNNLSVNDNPLNGQSYVYHCDQINYAVTLYNINDAVNALCEGIDWYNKTLN